MKRMVEELAAGSTKDPEVEPFHCKPNVLGFIHLFEIGRYRSVFSVLRLF